jgi:hypothetical protein
MERMAECARCGMLLDIPEIKAWNKRLFCKDCRTRRQRKIKYGDLLCKPWHGDFDEQDNPMLDGQLFMPGVRICLHKDCCNIDHIVAE